MTLRMRSRSQSHCFTSHSTMCSKAWFRTVTQVSASKNMPVYRQAGWLILFHFNKKRRWHFVQTPKCLARSHIASTCMNVCIYICMYIYIHTHTYTCIASGFLIITTAGKSWFSYRVLSLSLAPEPLRRRLFVSSYRRHVDETGNAYFLAHLYIYMYVCMYVYIYIYMYMYTYKHMHMFMGIAHRDGLPSLRCSLPLRLLRRSWSC